MFAIHVLVITVNATVEACCSTLQGDPCRTPGTLDGKGERVRLPRACSALPSAFMCTASFKPPGALWPHYCMSGVPWRCAGGVGGQVSTPPWQVRILWLPEVRGRTRMQAGLGKTALPCLPSENNLSENIIGGSVRECWGLGCWRPQLKILWTGRALILAIALGVARFGFCPLSGQYS